MLDVFAILLKAAFYAGSLTAVGVGVHTAIGMPIKSLWLRVAAHGLVLALALRLLSLNAEIIGGWGQVMDVSMFSWVWPSVRAQAVALGLGAVLLVAASVSRPRVLAGLGAIVTAAGFGLAGHTQALEGSSLASFAVAFHVLVAGFWVLAPVVLWPRSGADVRALAVRLDRFSRLAVWTVPMMVALGLWLSVQISGSIASLFQTAYGRLLLLKLGVASVALGIGAFNKLYVTTKLTVDGAGAIRHLRWALLADVVLFSIAIAAIAAATSVFGPH
ncbi:hypothetical protein GCM10009069_16420 [Algimonas arctica]|uniref:Copper resistance protein D domain-containing protein n=1 Tax=Algimonas arctica TaxID=1479486 RepID=A0A8J3CS37_9PROT|nr:hypothetical protein GCM10009069_16420 [Algimonas arctica]